MSKGLARNCSQVTRLEASLLTQNLHDEISEEESTSQPNTPDALDGPHSGNHCDQVQDSRSTNQSSTMVKQIVERQNHLIWQAYDAWRRKFPRPLDETEEQMVAISTEKLRNSATNSVVSKNDSRSLTCMLQPVWLDFFELGSLTWDLVTLRRDRCYLIYHTNDEAFHHLPFLPDLPAWFFSSSLLCWTELPLDVFHAAFLLSWRLLLLSLSFIIANDTLCQL